jgi:5'-phosphate synthase pdxT subunit
VGDRLLVGVLALQGAFAAHVAVVETVGADSRLVRRPADLTDLDALVLPGGESTTMSMLLESSGLFEPVQGAIAEGLAVFGTCAGMILLADHVLDGRSDQRSLSAIDITVRRNGYGRQIDSFETDLEVDGLASPFHAVFIRAPLVDSVGPSVEVLASVDGRAVLCRSGNVTVAAFHPELSNDARLHRQFLQGVQR